MSANKYITLAPSNDTTGTQAKRYRVLMGGWKYTIERSQSIEKAISGKLDVTEGGLITSQEYTIRLRHRESPDSLYGTRADLENLFRLNNPNGTPSNLVRFSDHYHDYAAYDPTTYADAILTNSLRIEPLTTIIDGDYAWFVINLSLVLIREIS